MLRISNLQPIALPSDGDVIAPESSEELDAYIPSIGTRGTALMLYQSARKHNNMTFSFKKNVLVLFFAATSISAVARGNSNSSFDWTPIIEAIIQVESEGNANAVSGKYCGAMQISPILVEECNNILKERNSKKRYSLKDRFSVEKSKEMFLLIQSHFNPSNNVEKAIRAWNGGNKYNVRSTNGYYRRVLSAMK